MYLYLWLKVRPGLINFVNGGLLDEDKFDSLGLGEPTTAITAATPNATRKSRKRKSSGNSSEFAELIGFLRSPKPTTKANEAIPVTNAVLLSDLETCNRSIADAKKRLKTIQESMEEADSDFEVEELELELDDAKRDIKFYLQKKKTIRGD
jgi:hypothetical protein